MEAIVLAGGFGTRLRSVINDRPKVMAPIGDRAFLEILLEYLISQGFNRVIFSLGYMADKVQEYLASVNYPIEIDTVVEREALGTGGGARLAISKCTDDHIYIFNGDTYLDLEVANVELMWGATRRPIIVGKLVEDTGRYGRILPSANSERVLAFQEKTGSGPGIINVGCYIFPRGQLDAYKVGDAFSLEKDYLGTVVKSEEFGLYLTDAQFIDIGVPEDYQRASSFISIV